MRNGSIVFRKARYYGSVTLIYLLTLLFAWYVFYPVVMPHGGPKTEALKSAYTPLPKLTSGKIISGMPVRITIPSLGIDLPVDPGDYNPADNSWTLSEHHAQFATLTSLPNDYSGNTFIYGHRNKYVFLILWLIKPGDKAYIYTANDHLFVYRFVNSQQVEPNDTSVISYQGPPILTIQTCSGQWNELRQMFTFKLVEVSR